MRDLGNILAPHQHAARERIVEAEQQPPDGALARARRSDDRGGAACGHLEAQPIEDRAARIIAEGDIVEDHRGLANDKRGRTRLVLHFDIGVDQAEHLAHVDQPLTDGAIDPAEHVQWAEQLDQQRIDQHQIADRQRPGAPAPHGIGHRRAHQRIGDDRLRHVEQADRVFGLHRRLGIGARGVRIARFLAALCSEILHRLVIQQRIHRAVQRLAVEIVHLAPQLGAPFGDRAGHPDIEHHGHGGGRNQLDPEIDVEDHAHRDQLDDGGGDVEQQEVEHLVDALGPALDDLGDLAGAPREVEAQAQAVEAVEHVLGQMQRRDLADPLEGDVAQVVEGDRGKAPQRIGRNQRERDGGPVARGARPRHRIDRALVGEGQRQGDGLGCQHQHHGDDDAGTQARIVARPEIGEEALERRPALHIARAVLLMGIGGGCGFGWHGAGCGPRGAIPQGVPA